MILEVTPSRISGNIAVPGSKSHTIRGITAALLADGTSQMTAPLESADTRSVLAAARQLGAGVKQTRGNWLVSGRGGHLFLQNKTLDLGNSGTGLRMLTAAVAAIGAEPVTLDGDDSLRTRVMAGELEALSALGASCSSACGYAPVTVRGPLSGGRTKVDGTTSQFLTALLFALPLAENDSVLDLDFLNEQDYVLMTLEWLGRVGITVKASPDLLHFEIPGRQRYRAFERVIPADFSTAAFPLAAALTAGTGDGVVIEHLDFQDVQGDKHLFGLAREMGGDICEDGSGVTVRKSSLHGGVFDLNRMPDALPVMSVLCAFADGESRLVNVPQARLKECDRIAAMTAELRKMGAEIEELPDGMVIHGGRPLYGASVDGHGDHRIVMALAVAALGARGVTRISGSEACAVTYPGFVADFSSLGAAFLEKVE